MEYYMKVLHILKSEPEESVEKFTNFQATHHETSVVVLYESATNWDALVDDIFEHDKVICWW